MADISSFLRRLFGSESSKDHSSSRAVSVNEPNLAFFNSLSAQLKVELTEPAVPVANLLNLAAPPAAEVQAVQFEAEVYLPESKDFRELTPSERDSVVLLGPNILLRGESGGVVAHEAPNGESFSVQELLCAVMETERQTRGDSEWLGGIDVHHCFFEGIYLDDQGVWCINWGS